MQKAILGLDVLNITQGYNGAYSHKGRYSLDLVGKNNGYIELRAPFDGIIKKVYTTNSNVVWLESLDKVEYANGVIDYMTIMTMHDDNISDLHVGKIVRQGEVYYRGGSSGNVTGPHIHLEVGRGKFINTGWYKNDYDKWTIYNNIRVNDALYLPIDCLVLYDYGYNWRRENETNAKNDIVDLQNALNNSYNVNLMSNTYDLETINVIAKNNLQYKQPTIKNDFVKWLQYKLVLAGYNLDIDSSYGKKTRDAVKMFQKKNSLVIDGIAGNGVVSQLLNL